MKYYTDLLTIIENNAMFISGSDVSILQEIRERMNYTDSVLSNIEGCTDDLTDERRLRMERKYDYFISLFAELVKKAQYLIDKYIGAINLYFKKKSL